MSSPAPQRLAVAAPPDAARARQAARALARRLGFGAVATEEFALAVSELATNLVRYARGGEILLAAAAAPDPPDPTGEGASGVRVESRDRGPGIADLIRAMEDGYSTGGGLGGGLPAARRLMDGFAITSGPAGTHVVAYKDPCSGVQMATTPRRPLMVGAWSRPYPGESANGDAWLVTWHGDACRVAVIDGLGHGPAAAGAAAAAVEVLVAAPHLDPVAALLTCHRALAGTRGAAISVAWFGPAEPGSPACRLVYAGVGNVEARLWQPDRERRPIAHRGIVGTGSPRGQPSEFALAGDWCLVVHTDGVSARFDLTAVPEPERRDPQGLAEAIVARWGRPADDATAVVVRPA